MNRYFRVIFVCTAIVMMLVATGSRAKASEPHEIILLWPDGAPDAKGTVDGEYWSMLINKIDQMLTPKVEIDRTQLKSGFSNP